MIFILPPRKPGDPPPRLTDRAAVMAMIFLVLAFAIAGLALYGPWR